MKAETVRAQLIKKKFNMEDSPGFRVADINNNSRHL